MIRIFLFVLLLAFSVNADLIRDLKRNKKVVVVYGENAPEAEKKAANEIFKILELDETDDLFDHIITDAYALKHQFFYSAFHLIIVGTPESNRLCSNNSEIQVAGPAKNSSQAKILPKMNNAGNGFYSAHFGYYPETRGIGYVRRMLNPFTLQSFNLTDGQMNANPYTATYICGTDTEGVTKAYINFLDFKMIQGAVIPEKYLAETNSRFKLSKASMNEKIMAKVNTRLKVRLGQEILEYKGWIQGAVGDYGGIKDLTGQSAEQIVHLKFASNKPQLLTYDDQVNTVLMVNFKDAASSLKALQEIDKKMKLSLKIQSDEKFTVYPCGDGQKNWYMMREGSMLFIENFSEQWKEPFFKQASGLLLRN